MAVPATAPTTATKSDVITSLDASPIVRPSAGSGAPVRVKRLQATITPTITQAVSVLNRMVRVPSNAIISRVAILCDTAATTLTGDVGVWFSDQNDGTSLVNQGNLTAISSAFFAAVLAMGTFAAVPGTDPSATIGLGGGFIDVTFANSGATLNTQTDGYYIPSQSGKPLWQAIANSLALQTTPVGPFTKTAEDAHFHTASAGASVYVRSDDPGGYFDICLQLTSTGSAANVKVTMLVEYTQLD